MKTKEPPASMLHYINFQFDNQKLIVALLPGDPTAPAHTIHFYKFRKEIRKNGCVCLRCRICFCLDVAYVGLAFRRKTIKGRAMHQSKKQSMVHNKKHGIYIALVGTEKYQDRPQEGIIWTTY